MMAVRGRSGLVLLCVLAHHAVSATCFSGPLAGRLPAPGRPLRRACVTAPRMTAAPDDESSPFFTLEEVNAAARATGKCCHGMPRAGVASTHAAHAIHVHARAPPLAYANPA